MAQNQIWVLKDESELRCEIGENSSLSVKLIEGNCNYLNLKSSKINKDSQLFIFWIEFKKKSDYLKITNSIKAFANKGVSISFYSSDNIYE